jgi:hypothetical protein
VNDQNHVEFDGVRYDAVTRDEYGSNTFCSDKCCFQKKAICSEMLCATSQRDDKKWAHWVKSANQPAAMPATPPKKKRVYSEPTKSDYIIRCMAAENTVKAQDIELTAQRQAREKAESAARELAEENIRLRARDGKLTTAASVLVVIAIALAFALIGGAR